MRKHILALCAVSIIGLATVGTADAQRRGGHPGGGFRGGHHFGGHHQVYRGNSFAPRVFYSNMGYGNRCVRWNGFRYVNVCRRFW